MANRKERESREIVYADYNKEIDQRESGFKPSTFTVPKDMSVFRFKETKTPYTIDVIPYQVTIGMGTPGGHPAANKGSWAVNRPFADHPNIGIDDKRFCCLRMWEKPCPICEEFAVQRGTPNYVWDDIKHLREKQRVLFYFYVHEEEDKGVQLFECSYPLGFAELLDERIKAIRKGKKKDADPRVQFFRLDSKGMSLEISCEEDSFQGRKFAKPSVIDFTPRDDDDPVDPDLYKDLPSLDSLLIETPYKKLKAIFLQGTTEPEEEEEEEDKEEETPPKKKVKKKPESEEETEEENESEEDETGEGREDSEDEDADGEEDGEEESEDEEEATEEEEVEEVEEDEEETEEEEETPPAKKKKPKQFPTAEQFGIEKGTRINHPTYGICTVAHVSSDGTSLRVLDKNEDYQLNINPEDCEVLKPVKPAAKPSTNGDKHPTKKKATKK